MQKKTNKLWFMLCLTVVISYRRRSLIYVISADIILYPFRTQTPKIGYIGSTTVKKVDLKTDVLIDENDSKNLR